MESKNRFLGTEPVKRLLWKLSIPTIAAQVINLLYTMVDRVYIGHMPGEGAAALTGVGVCMPVIMITSAFAALISSGGASRASIELGKGEHDRAEQILGNSFAMEILISVVITAVLLLFHRPILRGFGASAQTIFYSAAYMEVYAAGTLFAQMTLGMNAFIIAQGFAKTGMCSVLIGSACNIILDPVFIYRFHMGVQGAALATVLSQAVSAAWVLSFLTGPKTVIRIRKRCMKLRRDVVCSSLSLGLAPFFMQSSGGIVVVCLNASLQKYGGDMAVGAMTILSSALQFSMLPMQGLGQGAQPIISYSFGEGNLERVKETFRSLLIYSLLISFAAWLLFLLAPERFAGIFTSDSELISYTGWALRIYMAGICVLGAQVACQMSFIAIGNAGASITVAIMRKFILLLPLSYLLPLYFKDKAMAVYLAEPIADVASVFFTVTLFYLQFKKQVRKL